jgi:hypothetical protein
MRPFAWLGPIMSIIVPRESAALTLDQESSAIHFSRWQLLWATQFAAFFVVGIYAIATQRYLYGDGSYFLIMMLQQRDVLQFDFARHYAHWLTQLPAICLIRNFGCRGIGVIGTVYGTALIQLPLVGLLLTGWAARHAQGHYLVYPLIASSILFMDVSFFSISESLVGVALFFPMLYLLLLSERLNIIRSIALIGLAILATRTYECYLLLAWPLIVAAIRRGQGALRKRKYGELATCCLSGLLFLAAFGISAYSVLYPLNSDSRANFFLSTLLHLAYPPVWFSLLALTGVFWSLFIPERRAGWRLFCKSLLGCGLFVMILPLVGFVCPPLQYVSRIQCLYVPFVLGVAVLIHPAIEKVSAQQVCETPLELWRLASWACLVAAVFQLGATWRWDQYRNVLVQELQHKRGAIPFNESAVYASVFEAASHDGQRTFLDEFSRNPSLFTKQLIIGQFNWGWAIPSLSVILDATHHGSISSIVCAPASEGWQPFDPRNAATIPDLGDFGVQTEMSTTSAQ